MREIILIFSIVLLFAAPAPTQTPTPSPAGPPPQNNKLSVLDIKKQIDASPQKKNVMVLYDQKANKSMIRTNRFVLGRQQLFQDDPGERATNTPGFQSATIPTWEVSISSVFDTPYLEKTLDEYVWTFRIYNRQFPLESELVIKIDKEEIKFKPVSSGRSLTSDLVLSGGNFGLDRTSDSQRDNLGNRSQDAKPTILVFVLNRAEMDRIFAAPKFKVFLSKQYDVSLQKDYREAIALLLKASVAQ